MPSVANRALLTELTVYLAENNIRRGVLTVGTNSQADEEGVFERSVVLQPGQTFELDCIVNNKFTVIRVTKPVGASLITGTETHNFNIHNLFVLSDNFTSMVLTRPADALDATQVRIIQI